jgi:NSS family neurotransmitter:Na+ symporter
MEREKWKTRIGFLFASIGSAVGLGNIWRFPYLMHKSGGTGFLLPYILSMLFFALPLMMIELAIGRKFQSSIIASFRKIKQKYRFLAILPVLVNFLTLCYYVVIVGWTLGFFSFSLLKQNVSFSDFIKSFSPSAFTVLSVFIITIVVFSGVEKGIEKSSKIFMSLFFLSILLLFVATISTTRWKEAAGYYFKPDTQKIFDTKTWILAASQALFSLSVGIGIMITYGSYLSKAENIASSSIIIAFSDTIVSLINSLIIFSFVYTFSIEIEQGSRLAFEILPQLFSKISIGFLIQPIFFFLLFLAGMTSAISMKEVTVSNIVDELNWSRKKATITSFLILLITSVVISLNYSGFILKNMNLLETFDYIFGTILLILSSSIVCFIVSWNFNTIELLQEIDIKLEKVSKWLDNIVEKDIFLNLVRYIIPTFLLTLFLIELFNIF